MKRRDFVALLGGAATALPLAVRAQQAERMRRIGVLTPQPETDSDYKLYFAVFEEELNRLGWRRNFSVNIEYRWGARQAEARKTAAAELVRLTPDVIVAMTTPSVTALVNETRTLPIVFVQVSDPVGSGLVSNLARPGGNVTGLTNFEYSMGGKWMELLQQMAPNVRRAAVRFNPETQPGGGSFYLRTIEAATKPLAMEAAAAPFRTAADLERLFDELANDPNAGLVVLPDLSTTHARLLIVDRAAKQRLPAIYPFRFFAKDGGLISYGVDPMDLFRRLALYVDRILRGARPADLPVQQPTKFELVINFKTAKALGLEVPPMLLARADEVIE